MRDQEIRDVMNRPKNPKVTLKFRINEGRIYGFLVNEGAVFAKYFQCICDFPQYFLEKSFENIWRDSDGTIYGSLNVKNRESVLFVGSEMEIFSLVLHPNIHRALYLGLDRSKNSPLITWEIWADNAHSTGECDLTALEILDLHSFDPQ